MRTQKEKGQKGTTGEPRLGLQGLDFEGLGFRAWASRVGAGHQAQGFGFHLDGFATV